MRKVVVATAMALCVGVANAQYTVEILHSPLVPASSSYGAGAGGGQQVGHTNQFLVGPSHALMWSGTANSLVDLHPAGWDASYAMATDGVRQVGWRERHTGNTGQFATMWSGSAKGWVDLHDPTYSETNALSISGGLQVGYGFVQATGTTRAVMWENSAASIVSLHPTSGNVDRSWASATDGKQQVGYAGNVNTTPRAALWTGTAESYVDLHPDGYLISEATGVANGQQVGRAGSPGGAFHAGLWNGGPGSFVDLNPGEGFGSQAHATNAVVQVGEYAPFVGNVHAAAWFGSAASMIDLHQLLSSQYLGKGELSRATGIDEFGNIVGWARHIPSGENHAVLWAPVPEPSTIFLIGLSTLYLVWGRRRRQP